MGTTSHSAHANADDWHPYLPRALVHLCDVDGIAHEVHEERHRLDLHRNSQHISWCTADRFVLLHSAHHIIEKVHCMSLLELQRTRRRVRQWLAHLCEPEVRVDLPQLWRACCEFGPCTTIEVTPSGIV